MLENFFTDIETDDERVICRSDFKTSDTTNKNSFYSMLYFSGYLTIKEVNSVPRKTNQYELKYTLDYPNEEVKDSYGDFLKTYKDIKEIKLHFVTVTKQIINIKKDAVDGKFEKLTDFIKEKLFSKLDYYAPDDKENLYQSVLQILFDERAIFNSINKELVHKTGRIDYVCTIEHQKKKVILIIEIKIKTKLKKGKKTDKEFEIEKLAKCTEAMNQIINREYYTKATEYNKDPSVKTRIFLLALNFIYSDIREAKLVYFELKNINQKPDTVEKISNTNFDFRKPRSTYIYKTNPNRYVPGTN